MGAKLGKLLVGSIELSHASSPDDRQPYEEFILTVNPDATRTLRTVTQEPHEEVFRDVHLTVGPDWRTIVGYDRLYVGGVLQGTIWQRIAGDKLLSELLLPNGQLDEASFPIPPSGAVGYHAVAGDAWAGSSWYDMARGGRQENPGGHTVSLVWNGGTLSHGSVVSGSSIEFLGRRQVTVPAGTFDCEGFMLIFGPRVGHDLEMWRTGPDHVFVEMRQHGPGRDRIYSLASLRDIATR